MKTEIQCWACDDKVQGVSLMNAAVQMASHHWQAKHPEPDAAAGELPVERTAVLVHVDALIAEATSVRPMIAGPPMRGVPMKPTAAGRELDALVARLFE